MPGVAEAVCSAGMAAVGQVLVGEAGGLWPGLDLQPRPEDKLNITSLRCCLLCYLQGV